MSNQVTVQVEFVDSDPASPDPASVSDFADQVLADLRSRGVVLQPVHTDAMGGDVYELIRQIAEGAAANKDILVAMISGVIAPIVSVIAERVRQRDKASANPSASAPPVVVIMVEDARSEVVDPDISADELLSRLLAADPQLAEKVAPQTKSVVRVAGRRDRR
ncbi:hypothetical protein [Chloroflexus sp.]|uniref:hypothetical protein n=1 Tax=Chloroflexus sp. TaxID=1904827 RepID=UPI00404B16A4